MYTASFHQKSNENLNEIPGCTVNDLPLVNRALAGALLGFGSVS